MHLVLQQVIQHDHHLILDVCVCVHVCTCVHVGTYGVEIEKRGRHGDTASSGNENRKLDPNGD